MEVPNSTIITKLANGNVSVSATGGDYNVNPSSTLTKELNGVKVTSPEGEVLRDFKVATVERVISADGGDVLITDVDTLYTQLDNFFFFEVGGVPSGTVLSNPPITQTLTDGDNTISHNLGKDIIAFTVKDSTGKFINTTGNIIDSDDFNVNVSGGGPIVDALIILQYIN